MNKKDNPIPFKINVKESIVFIVRNLFIGSRRNNDIKKWLVYALCIIIFSTSISLLIPFIFKYTVAVFWDEKSKYIFAMSVLFSYGIIYITSQILIYAREMMFTRILRKTVANAVEELFVATIMSENERYHKYHIGLITRSIARVTESITRIVFVGLPYGLPLILEILVLTFILANFYNIILVLVILLTIFALLMYTIKFTNKALLPAYMDLVMEDNKSQSFILDRLLNHKLIKESGTEFYQRRKLSSIISANVISFNHYDSLALRLLLHQKIIIGVGIMLTILITGHYILIGSMDPSDIILINGYMLQIITPVARMGDLSGDIMKAFVNLTTMSAEVALSAKTKTEDTLMVKTGSISIENVSFGHNTKSRTLQDININIASGETIGILGQNNSGKSTLIDLLIGNHSSYEGSIKIDGQDIKNIASSSLKNCISVVAQDTMILNDTVFNNITLNKRNTTLMQVIEISEKLGLHNAIKKLNNGYDTVINQNSVHLSINERQMIGIARSLIDIKPIVIIDETTRAFNLDMEIQLNKKIQSIIRGKTTIIISSKANSIKTVDRIYVMSKGRVVGEGTHEDLIGTCREYSSLYY